MILQPPIRNLTKTSVPTTTRCRTGTAGGRRVRARKMSQAAAPRAASDEKAMPTGASTCHDPRPTARKLPMNRLDNKVCLVTGAASGIGKRIAEVYAANGGKVVIADLKIDAAEVAAKEIRDAGGDALAVAMDVTEIGRAHV